VLLTVAGAAADGFRQILNMPLGYDPSNTLLINVGLTSNLLKTWPERVARLDAIQRSIEAVPGVLAVTSDDDVPPGADRPLPEFELVGNGSLRQPQARRTGVESNDFAQLHIPLLQGRMWTNDEARNGVPLAVVNSTFAKRFSGGRTLLGRTLRLSDIDLQNLHCGVVAQGLSRPEVEIFGVVGDSVNDGLDKPVLHAIYYNKNLLVWPGKLFFVHTAGAPPEYIRNVALAARNAVGKAYIFAVPDMLEDFLEREPMWRTQRLIAVLLAIFAVFALALSLVGLYSVVSYVVARRTSEFGIRLALGAKRSHVMALVMRSNLAVIFGGIAVDLFCSFAVRSRFAQWSDYSSRSPVLTLAAALFLILGALLASLLPAYRASNVEPSIALRAE
jgi:putative ABC transport system permease protein